MLLIQDCEATDLRALQQGEKVKPHKVAANNCHVIRFFDVFFNNLSIPVPGDLWIVLGQLWCHLGEDGGQQHQPGWQEQGQGKAF